MATLLHTADWHLGRIFHGAHLTEEQSLLLERLVAMVADHRPDCVIIAGDVYDRAVPPPEAVTLLDSTLSRLVCDLGAPVVLIAGNHDSPDRLAFGSRILERQGLHLFGRLTDAAPAPVRIEDEHGVVEIHAIPYAEPAQVRSVTGEDSLLGHDQALGALVERARQTSRAGRRVLVAHAFVEGGLASDSERPLSVGGAGAVDAGRLAGFDYVALGHLHRRQQVGDRGAIHYPGSLYPYSFAEIGQDKSVNLVQIGPEGLESVTRLPLEPRRSLRRLSGTLEQLASAPAEGNPEDYLLVSLADRGPVFDAMGKLRARYPNVLHIERQELQLEGQLEGQGPCPAAEQRETLDDAALFGRFFEDVQGEVMSDREAEALAAILETLDARQREAEP